VAAGGHNEPIGLWDLASGRIQRAGGGRGCVTCFLTYATDSKTLLSADGGVHLYEWDPATGKQLSDREGPPLLLHVAFRPGQGLLAGAAHGNRVHFWDVAAGKQRTVVQGPEKGTGIFGLALTSDGKTAAASSEGAIHLWDAASGTEIRRLKMPGRGGWLGFGPDDRTLAYCDGSSEIVLWDAAQGTILGRLQSPVYNLGRTAFSRDGRLLAAGAFDGSVQVWEVCTGAPVRRFQGHIGPALSVAFAPDGQMVASAGVDTTVLLWDLSGRMKGGRLAAARYTARELEALWLDLAGENGARGYDAVWALASAPAQAVPFLVERVKGRVLNQPKIAQWIAELDDRRFVVREQAMRALQAQGTHAGPALRAALDARPTEEVRRRIGLLLATLTGPKTPSERWAAVRSVAALERIGTPDARLALRRLGDQQGDAGLAREARAALRRLGAP
jgi:hypothetical protein